MDMTDEIGQFALEHPLLFTIIGSVVIAILIHIYCFVHRIRFGGINKMSGGSMNYFYLGLEEHQNRLGDRELNDLVHDLAKVFHDREWFESGDISEGEYNKTVMDFKDKWFTDGGTNERREKYIQDAIEELRNDLCMSLSYCKDCAKWTRHEQYENYGKCEKEKTCLTHGYERPCPDFKKREV